MLPEVLAKELRARGLTILAVSPHSDAPDLLTVYLHGNAGQWVGGAALFLVADVPGVLAVVESVQARSILLVRVSPVEGDGEAVAPS